MRTLLTFLVCTISLPVFLQAQDNYTYARTDSVSYDLYQRGDWESLYQYGQQAVAAGQDFVMLRQRMGYAAFMLGNYSASISQYEKVLKEDVYNQAAHYYIYWSRVNLNQPELAMAEIKYMNSAAIPLPQQKASLINAAGLEYSYKKTDITTRGNAGYTRFLLGARLGNVQMDQSVALYNQTINEPLLTAVNNNSKIAINQPEYYNRVHINLNRHWQLKAAWHYLYTPFNNFRYNNNLLLAGIKYYGSYLDLQADAIIGKLTDTSLQQYNLQLGLYPLGNLKLYSFSTGMIRQQAGTAFNFKQVLGVQVCPAVWIEGNITAGRFRNLAENDALYVYHAIDPNKSKAGITTYIMLKHFMVQLGYTNETRELFGTISTYTQQSITGGIIWKR
jgi:tetratricopeptide (TPR) repeat protein